MRMTVWLEFELADRDRESLGSSEVSTLLASVASETADALGKLWATDVSSAGVLIFQGVAAAALSPDTIGIDIRPL
jgi:hypothetical protein